MLNLSNPLRGFGQEFCWTAFPDLSRSASEVWQSKTVLSGLARLAIVVPENIGLSIRPGSHFCVRNLSTRRDGLNRVTPFGLCLLEKASILERYRDTDDDSRWRKPSYSPRVSMKDAQSAHTIVTRNGLRDSEHLCSLCDSSVPIRRTARRRQKPLGISFVLMVSRIKSRIL